MKHRAKILGVVGLLAGCADRDAVWDAPIGAPQAFELESSAAIVDAAADRALFLGVDGNLNVDAVSLPIGHNFTTAVVAPDRRRLLVLSRGDVPQRKKTDDPPKLTLLEGGIAPRVAATFALSDPLSGLALDPEGRYAVLYPSAADSGFVSNPNQLLLVDLEQPPSATNPLEISLRSFGGTPERFTFTEELALPGGPTRLLVVETDRDVGIIDLAAAANGDITVKLSSSATPRAPAQIAFDRGSPGGEDAKLAIRLENDSSVILVDMVRTPPDDRFSLHAFHPRPNVVFVGGTASDVTFLKTDGGPRLGALVPALRALTLVDPVTGISSQVDLGAPFDHLSLVTSVVGSEDGADVALVWSAQSSEIAFVALGTTVGRPYKSVDRFSLAQPVSGVANVPAPNDRLKLLSLADGTSFVVLDLIDRTAAPIFAREDSSVNVASDGRRAWMVGIGAPDIAKLDLPTLHPKNLALANPISTALDIGRRDGGRALLAVHPTGGVGVTVLDGNHPELAHAVEYVGLLLGDLR